MLILILITACLLVNFFMLGTSRLRALIRAAAWQAFFLLSLGLSLRWQALAWHEWLLLALTATIKCLVFPYLLERALRETVIQREVEPILGYSLSILVGLLFLAGSIWVVTDLPLPRGTGNSLVLGTAIFTVLSGFILIIGRVKAITQTIGYLVLENGIYLLGLTLGVGTSALVEMGVLLDIFVGVFVMGIIVFHINREFSHIDTDKMTLLVDD
jgi:hydrogenase-4 component E